MASLARTANRAAFRSTPATSAFKASRRSSVPFTLSRNPVQPVRRGYASSSGGSSSGGALFWGLGLVAAGGAGYYAFVAEDGLRLGATVKDGSASGSFAKGGVTVPKAADYQQVYNAIAKLLEEKDEYDDGSYGPVLLRLAWHASGTYDALTKTGGSNGATMRFAPEGDHGANAGLKAARDFLEPVKTQFPWISYSDLWTLAGVAAIQEMQGPAIPWRPGRADADAAMCTPDGRLPDASKEQTHLRAIFGRMGFDDREIVALSGAHALGRCHTDRSGYDGPWTFSPTVLTNDYYKLLLEEKWNWKKWNGPKQYEDKTTKTLMMLPTDMVLIKDAAFKKHVDRYARDNEAFFGDFRDVIVKLFELGVPFKSSEADRMTFRSTHAD
ncbi:MAG: heme peroxidase [Thelocarpon impressellum]|nr:MAG: heme peroxidase [Thelocarpon impressellum]